VSQLIGGEGEPHVPHDTTRKLVMSANQIADFFGSQGRHEHAAASTADHLKSFWTPDMRQRIYAHLDATGGEGLKPIALEGVKLLRKAAPGTIRRELAEAGEPSGRDPGDDAG
jgi:formate dehydrogenase subunit delta